MGTLGYDLAGRINAVANSADATTRTYVEGQPGVETHTAGPLRGQGVGHDYDGLGRLGWYTCPPQQVDPITYGGTGGALSGVTCAGGTTALGAASSGDGGLRTSPLDTLDGERVGRLGPEHRSGGSTAGGTTVFYTHHYDADGHCDSATAPEGAGPTGLTPARAGFTRRRVRGRASPTTRRGGPSAAATPRTSGPRRGSTARWSRSLARSPRRPRSTFGERTCRPAARRPR